jgi:hypothetical protein
MDIHEELKSARSLGKKDWIGRFFELKVLRAFFCWNASYVNLPGKRLRARERIESTNLERAT